MEGTGESVVHEGQEVFLAEILQPPATPSRTAGVTAATRRTATGAGVTLNIDSTKFNVLNEDRLGLGRGFGTQFGSCQC